MGFVELLAMVLCLALFYRFLYLSVAYILFLYSYLIGLLFKFTYDFWIILSPRSACWLSACFYIKLLVCWSLVSMILLSSVGILDFSMFWLSEAIFVSGVRWPIIWWVIWRLPKMCVYLFLLFSNLTLKSDIFFPLIIQLIDFKYSMQIIFARLIYKNLIKERNMITI